MNKKEKMQKDIEDALKDEEKLQQDRNEEPITYVSEDEIDSSIREENLKHDRDEDPVTFVEESDDNTE